MNHSITKYITHYYHAIIMQYKIGGNCVMAPKLLAATIKKPKRLWRLKCSPPRTDFCSGFTKACINAFTGGSLEKQGCNNIYMIPVRGSLPPPPPPHGMVPKPAICSIPHENVVFAVFFAWWVAGAVRNPANSLDFCNQPSENVLFAMLRLRHRGVVPPRPLLFLCRIII